MEEEGSMFTMEQVVILIVFLAVVGVLIALYFIFGGMSGSSFSDTVSGFGKRVLGIIGG